MASVASDMDDRRFSKGEDGMSEMSGFESLRFLLEDVV